MSPFVNIVMLQRFIVTIWRSQKVQHELYHLSWWGFFSVTGWLDDWMDPWRARIHPRGSRKPFLPQKNCKIPRWLLFPTNDLLSNCNYVTCVISTPISLHCTDDYLSPEVTGTLILNWKKTGKASANKTKGLVVHLSNKSRACFRDSRWPSAILLINGCLNNVPSLCVWVHETCHRGNLFQCWISLMTQAK